MRNRIVGYIPGPWQVVYDLEGDPYLIRRAEATYSPIEAELYAQRCDNRVYDPTTDRWHESIQAFMAWFGRRQKWEQPQDDSECRQCGRPVEEARRVYASPICYTCLPPPEPLPIVIVKSKGDDEQ